MSELRTLFSKGIVRRVRVEGEGGGVRVEGEGGERKGWRGEGGYTCQLVTS